MGKRTEEKLPLSLTSQHTGPCGARQLSPGRQEPHQEKQPRRPHGAAGAGSRLRQGWKVGFALAPSQRGLENKEEVAVWPVPFVEEMGGKSEDIAVGS